MTSYLIQIKQCPECGCQFKVWAIASCNTIDARFYTDGSVEGSMYEEGSALLTCPECNRYFWQEDVPTRKTIPDWEYTDDFAIEGLLDSLPSSGSVYRYDYENVLNQGLWKNDIQEKYIRIRAWWSFNDAYRRRAAEDFRVPPDQETNLRRLLQLLDTNHPDESIMKAEILRELGEFDPCLQVLDRNFDEEYIKTSDIIKAFAKSGRRQVERIE